MVRLDSGQDKRLGNCTLLDSEQDKCQGDETPLDSEQDECQCGGTGKENRSSVRVMRHH